MSESEREVSRYQVYKEVLFMLLDSLEAIDSNRIADLVEYFEEYTNFLSVALLPEDAKTIDDRHGRIRSI